MPIDTRHPREIRAAGIDVFEEEPVSSAGRLLQLDNVIVSPHIRSRPCSDHDH